MLFSFLKYLQPTHYFQKYNTFGASVFPVVSELPSDVKQYLVKDTAYSTHLAMDYDLSWQALQLGYIGDCKTYTEVSAVTVKDNYHFIRKNFHPFWVFFVFCIRIVSLHNPIQEFLGWYTTRKTARLNIKAPIQYSDWENFKSEMLAKKPKVSVLIPTLNRYSVLKDVLQDLEQQDYTNFEVVVVDQSDNYNPDFYNNFKLDIKLVRQEEKALWLARNTAIKSAQGELIALSEDDVRIKPDWLSLHIKCLDYFKAKVSAGVFYPEGGTIPLERSFFSVASQFATGNAMLFKNVFKTVGLFDRQFEKQRMGDGEFGMRVYLAGIKSVSNPYASCIDVKAPTGGLREMGSWDAFRPSNFFAPRPIPSVTYFFRRYFGNKPTRLALLRLVPLSLLSYQFKASKPMLVISIGLSIILSPIIMCQVCKSWWLASKKLKEGAKIQVL